jgi:16S rRNA (adenine1518-N6/adenine1519-N6)-dimethyltransferase
MAEIKPKKELGQHWLHDQGVLDAICVAADIAENDHVIEIGPGLGTLTQNLLDNGAKVHAIEFDHDLAISLRARIKSHQERLEISEADIMRFDFTSLPKEYKIVANIPYYLTSGLLRLISETANPPKKAVLLVQKEVAERVCAKPGQTSLLSISTQMYFDASLGILVPAALFTPPPKVDSQVLVLERREAPYFGDADEKKIFQVVKAGFSERRKKLRSSLSGGLGISKEAADSLLTEAGINGDLRAQNLTLENWVQLARVLKSEE